MSPEIPTEVRRLLRDCVETYEQLEALILFGGPHAGTWTAEAAAAKLGLTPPVASEALECLSRAGAVDRVDERGPARFVAASRWAGGIDALGTSYRVDRLGVMNLMTANALERVRTSAIRAFAASFLLGKKDNG